MNIKKKWLMGLVLLGTLLGMLMTQVCADGDGVKYGFIHKEWYAVENAKEIFGEGYEMMDSKETVRFVDADGEKVSFGFPSKETGLTQDAQKWILLGVFTGEVIEVPDAGLRFPDSVAFYVLIPEDDEDLSQGELYMPTVLDTPEGWDEPHRLVLIEDGFVGSDAHSGVDGSKVNFEYYLSGTELVGFFRMFGSELKNVQIGINYPSKFVLPNSPLGYDMKNDFNVYLNAITNGINKSDNDGEIVRYREDCQYILTLHGATYLPAEVITDEMTDYLIAHDESLEWSRSYFMLK